MPAEVATTHEGRGSNAQEEGTMTRKQFVQALEDNRIGYDKVVAHKVNNSFEFRNGYYYHHPEADASRLAKAQAAFPCAIVTQYDHFACWPKDSWIGTVVTFSENARCEEAPDAS